MTVLPTLRQLGYLVALADHCHFGRAAETCLVTQSTLSAGLQELETALGAVLVERTKRKVILTPLGEEVAARARALLAQARELVETVQAAAEPLTGTVRLGAIPTIAPFLLPDVLPKLRADQPRLRLILREDLTHRLLDRLTAGELDVALLAVPWRLEEMEVEDLGTDSFQFVAPPGHALVQAPVVPLAALRRADLLLLEDGHCLRDHALAACRLTAAPGASGTHETQGELVATSLHTLVQMVAGGLGVTLLPEMAVRAGLVKGAGLVARPFDEPQVERGVALVWRRSSPRKAEFRRLADYFRAAMTGARRAA